MSNRMSLMQIPSFTLGRSVVLPPGVVVIGGNIYFFPVANPVTGTNVDITDAGLTVEKNVVTATASDIMFTLPMPPLTNQGGYMEITITEAGGADGMAVGLKDIDNFTLDLDNGVFYRSGGSTYVDNVIDDAFTPYVDGDVVMIAWKYGKVWFGLNGTWNGDPGLNDTESAIYNAWMAPYFWCDALADQPKATFNFGGSPFLYVNPLGFERGWTSFGEAYTDGLVITNYDAETFLRMDETAGSTAFDETANAYDYTIIAGLTSNNPTYYQNIDRKWDLNGTSQYIARNPANELDALSQGTVFVMGRVDSFSTESIIHAYLAPSGTLTFVELFVETTGALTVALRNNSTGQELRLRTATGVISLNETFFVAWVATGRRWKVFLATGDTYGWVPLITTVIANGTVSESDWYSLAAATAQLSAFGAFPAAPVFYHGQQFAGGILNETLTDEQMWQLARSFRDSVLEEGHLLSPANAPNLRVKYDMEAVTSSLLPDVSDNGIDGTVSGAIVNTGDPLTGARSLEFDGGNDTVDFGTVSDFNFIHETDIFTVSLWFKLTANPDDVDTWPLMGNTSTGTGFGIQIDNSGGAADHIIDFFILNAGAVSVQLSSPILEVESQSWRMVTVTGDGNNSYMYIDGVLAVQGAATSLPTGDAGATCLLGKFPAFAEHFEGLMDEVSIWDRQMSPSEVAELYFNSVGKYRAGDYRFVKGYWLMSNIVTVTVLPDESPTGASGTLVGTPTILPGAIGGALEFNGSTQYVDNVGIISDFNFVHEEAVFAISVWVRTDIPNGGALQVIMGSAFTPTSLGFSLGLEDRGAPGDRQVRMYMADGVGAAGIDMNGAIGTIADTNWHHILVTANGDICIIYVDGVQDGATGAVTALGSGDASGLLDFARSGDFSSFYLDGAISTPRIINQYIQPEKVLAFYGEIPDILRDDHEDLVVFYTMDRMEGVSVVNDDSPSQSDLKLFGATLPTQIPGQFAQGMDFNGANHGECVDFVDLTGSDRAVSFWCRSDQGMVNHQGPFENRKDAEWGFNVVNESGRIKSVDGPAGTFLDSGLLFSTATVFHIVVQVVGTEYEIYVDGVFRNKATYTPTAGGTQYTFEIGRTNNNYTWNFPGWVDQFRGFKRALTPEEIMQLYQEDPPTPDNAHGDLALVYEFDRFEAGNVIDRSPAGLLGTVVGSPAIIEKGAPVGNSMYFDGLNDYINLPAQPFDPEAAVGWTVAFWHNSFSASGSEVVSFRNIGTGDLGLRVRINTTGDVVVSKNPGSGAAVIYLSALPLDHWDHVAVAQDATNFHFFINGQLKASSPLITYSGAATDAWAIGTQAGIVSTLMNAQIGDLRMFQRALLPREVAMLYAESFK